MDFEKKISPEVSLVIAKVVSNNFSSIIVYAAGSLRYHGCSKVIYSAMLLAFMEKHMGEPRGASFAVNGWCDIM